MAGEVFYDRVLETSTITGTSTYTLAGAVSGYQSFAVVGNANLCFYCAAAVDANGNPNGGWEVGSGTYTTSGTTLARTTVIASSNANAAVNWASNTAVRIALVNPASNAIPDVQTFTVSGTWTKPKGKTFWAAYGVGIGGSGAGGSGSTQGAGGGGPGAINWGSGLISALGSTVTVTLASAPTGGAINTDGVAGGTITFGSVFSVAGGGAGLKDGTAGAAGVGAITGQSGGAGGNGAIGTNAVSSIGPGGGGGGGGGVAVNGGTGASRSTTYDGAGSGSAGTGGGNGGAGGSVTTNIVNGGAGGGGGAGAGSGNAGNGGNAGSYGGGGGGGGVTNHAGNNGTGGNGGPGILVVVSW